MSNSRLTQERLKEILHYDPETGVFTRAKRTSNCVRVGDEAGGNFLNGVILYRVISVENRIYRGHRLAWLYVYGSWPDGLIDHINGDGTDNRIANLRTCSYGGNQQNRTVQRNNKSGLLGVCWHKASGKWHAQIHLKGFRHHLGLFSTKEEAHEAYLTAKAQLHAFQPTPRASA